MDGKRREIIARAIELGGGSQAELARRVGCAQQHISKLLHGQAALTSDLSVKICQATNNQVLISELAPELFEAVIREVNLSRQIGVTA